LPYVFMKGGQEKMKIALAVWKNRISPVFDSSRVVVLVDIKNSLVTSKRYVHLKTELPSNRAMELVDLDVKILICGAISQIFAYTIESHGIEIIPSLPDLVLNAGILVEDGWFILEHGKNNSFVHHPQFQELRRYGSVHFSIFERSRP